MNEEFEDLDNYQLTEASEGDLSESEENEPKEGEEPSSKSNSTPKKLTLIPFAFTPDSERRNQPPTRESLTPESVLKALAQEEAFMSGFMDEDDRRAFFKNDLRKKLEGFQPEQKHAFLLKLKEEGLLRSTPKKDSSQTNTDDYQSPTKLAPTDNVKSTHSKTNSVTKKKQSRKRPRETPQRQTSNKKAKLHPSDKSQE